MTTETIGVIGVVYILFFYTMLAFDVCKLVYAKTRNKKGSVFFAAMFPIGFVVTCFVLIFKGIRGSK
ncbi:TPA: hypothetical protein NGU66_001358 [Vibrio parahaemolyticus]|nr:hypothetical protein [Vibrio parahaemolyticus]